MHSKNSSSEHIRKGSGFAGECLLVGYMAVTKTTVAGVKVKRGANMTTGKGWKLVGKNGRAFKARFAKEIGHWRREYRHLPSLTASRCKIARLPSLSLLSASPVVNKRSLFGFLARGYFVSTVGRDEATIRKYIRNQEKEYQRIDLMNLWKWPATVKVAQTNRGRVRDPA
jgi:hypothetical protein